MVCTTTTKKIKWPKNGLNNPLKFRLYYPPVHRPKKTQQWDNWLRSMSMDTRFSGTERSILTQIALHYNLKTGDCFPSRGRLAVEAGLNCNDTGKTAVKRAVNKAVELGWLERKNQSGGARWEIQTNQYDLTLPVSIQHVLSNTGLELAVAQVQGEWHVVQKDGVAICGPFKSKTGAKRWLAEHGPGGQIEEERGDISTVAGGQIEGSEGTNGQGRGDISPPITWKI
jgi:hypothetical protein